MFEEFNHFFQEEYFDLSIENEIIFEAYTKKQENRIKKFLKENNFKEDNSKLTKEQIRKGYRAGTIETSITDENGKKKRVDFEISPHDDNSFKYNTVTGKAKGIQMSKKTLARKPHIANFIFKHEEGHYACYLDKDTGKYVLDLYKIKRLIEKYPDDFKNYLNAHDKNPEEILADKYAQEHIPDKYKDKLYKTLNMKDYTIKFNKVIGFNDHNESQRKINKAASKLFPNPEKVNNTVEELNNKKKQIKEIIKDETRRIEAEKELCDEQKKIINELHERIDNINHSYSNHVMKGYVTPNGRQILKDLKKDLENTNQYIIKINNKIASKKEAQEYYQKIVDSCSVVAKPYLEEERKLLIASYDDESIRKKLEEFRNNAPKEVDEFYKASSKLLDITHEIRKLTDEQYGPWNRAYELESKIDKVRSGNKIDYNYKSMINRIINEIKEAEKSVDDYDKSIKKRKMKLQDLDRQIEKIDKKIKTVKNPTLEKMSYEQRKKYLDKYVNMILTNDASDITRALLSANTPEEIESLLKKTMNDPNFVTESYGPEDDDTSGTSEFDESYNNDPDDCYCESFDFVTSDTIQESTTIPRSNEVYTNGGSIEKINDFPFDKVYFGSPNKLPSTMELDGPMFITPYLGIASIFSVRPQNLQKYGVPKGVRCNRDYDEWNRSLKDTVLQKSLTELHVRIQGENIKIKPTTELVSGYLYTIDVTPEIRDHIYQSSKMSKVFEFCIDKMDSVTFSNIKKINARMTVTGEELPQEFKEGYVQEAKCPTSKRNKLPDSDFALVYTDANGKKIRKYPVYDKAHVKAAAKMFPRGIPLKYQKKVAKRILRKAHGYDIDTSNWKIAKRYNESFIDDIDDNIIQEGMLNDLMNGVNPQSKKRFFHITRDKFYSENDMIPDDMIFKTFTPQIPKFAAEGVGSDGFATSADGKYREEGKTPRICVSPSIEGCLNSLRLYLPHSNHEAVVERRMGKGVWYVYTPLQDISKYHIKSNADIVKNNLVWDAKYTKETWLLDKTTMVLYGVIKVDKVIDPDISEKEPTQKGKYHLKENMEGRFHFKWHWVKSNKDIMNDKHISEKIKDALEKQSKDKNHVPDIPKSEKRKQQEIDAENAKKKAEEEGKKRSELWNKNARVGQEYSDIVMKVINGKDVSKAELTKARDAAIKARKEYCEFEGRDPEIDVFFPKDEFNKLLEKLKK